MINVHESTLALSVYRAVGRCGPLTPEQVVAFLRREWDPEFDADDLQLALGYLASRLMVVVGETVTASRLTRGGVAATVIRDPKDESSLIYGAAA